MASIVAWLLVWIFIRRLDDRIVTRERVAAQHHLYEERERGDAALRQSDRAKLVAEMAAGVAHDLNHVCGLLKNYTKLLQRRLQRAGRVNLEVESVFGSIGAAIEEAEVLTRQLSTIAHELPSLGIIEVDVAGLLLRLVRLCAFPGIEIITDIAPSLPPAYFDEIQLEQILFNLLLNARDACEEDEDGFIWVGAQPVNGRVQISITDNGRGMDAEMVKRIFEPSFTMKEGGLGIGLSNTHRLVQLGEGELTVGSTPGKGTVFKLTLLPQQPESASLHVGEDFP